MKNINRSCNFFPYLSIYPICTFQHNVTDRLVALQRFAAQLELQEKQLKKRNSQLESQNESLKRGRDTLRDTLIKVHTHSHISTCRPSAACKGLGPRVQQVQDWMISERHQVTDDTFPFNFQPNHLVIPILSFQQGILCLGPLHGIT